MKVDRLLKPSEWSNIRHQPQLGLRRGQARRYSSIRWASGRPLRFIERDIETWINDARSAGDPASPHGDPLQYSARQRTRAGGPAESGSPRS